LGEFEVSIACKLYRSRTAEGWEFVALDFDDDEEVADYGTAGWKGPPLELVFTDVVISIKKRFLGEKESSCFSIGLIFDAEFDMRREPFVAQCEDASEKARAWSTTGISESVVGRRIGRVLDGLLQFAMPAGTGARHAVLLLA
jgi:hypothetical protein